MTKHQVTEELHQVLIFTATIWLAFIANWLIPIEFNQYGIVPRTLSGLLGIFVSPLLHANFSHIASNTVPLVILLILLAGSRANSWMIVSLVVLLGGGLLWLFGRHAIHIGASGLIYGLIAFLIVAGLLERRFVPLLISVGVGFAYGSTLLSGVLPSVGSQISWDGHLTGAIAGAAVAWGMVRDTKS